MAKMKTYPIEHLEPSYLVEQLEQNPVELHYSWQSETQNQFLDSPPVE